MLSQIKSQYAQLASVTALRCFFAEGEIGGTLCMRSYISVHLATTKYFSISFIFKNKIEKEGLPRDSPAGLGAGGHVVLVARYQKFGYAELRGSSRETGVH